MEKNSNEVRKSESIEELFPQVKGAPILKMEEQMAIIMRVQQGSKEAEEELKWGNIRFVATMAMRYLDQGLSKDELFKAGMDGLMAAGHKYNPRYRIKFVFFKMWWIRKAIEDAIEGGR